MPSSAFTVSGSKGVDSDEADGLADDGSDGEGGAEQPARTTPATAIPPTRERIERGERIRESMMRLLWGTMCSHRLLAPLGSASCDGIVDVVPREGSPGTTVRARCHPTAREGLS
jgi:hypothetical protein